MLNISIYYLFCFIIWLFALFVSDKWVRQVSLIIGFLILIWSVYVAFIFSYYTTLFDNTVLLYQFSLWNFNYQCQIDGISILFIILSNLLLVLCLLVNWNVKYKQREAIVMLYFVNFMLFNVFVAVELIFFYIFFEAILIPMFLLIGIWGSRERKVKAAYQFFLYTLLGSVFMIVSILWLYSHYGTTDIRLLNMYSISVARQLIFWLGFFVSIAIKVPMVPVHIWLPEAHVEAPTVGSVILAGVLLKLGTYAVIKFLFPLFLAASMFYAPAVLTLSIFGILYASLTTLTQVDMKKIVAYSSVAHMNYVVLGLFVFNVSGFVGAMFLMLSHGLVSSGLFMIVGFLYERYKTRILLYFGGIARMMPLFTFMFFVFVLANMSFPGTFSFVGEFLVLMGVMLKSTVIGVLAALGMIFAAGYSLMLYNNVFFSTLKINVIKGFADLTRRETFCLFTLFWLVLLLGIKPSFLSVMFDRVAIGLF